MPSKKIEPERLAVLEYPGKEELRQLIREHDANVARITNFLKKQGKKVRLNEISRLINQDEELRNLARETRKYTVTVLHPGSPGPEKKEAIRVVNNSFTAKEDRFIIRNCKKMGYAEVAAHLGRPSQDSIHQRVEVLEKQGKLERSGQVREGVFHAFYSEKEDEIIKKLYPSLGKKVLAKRLKRPESSIRYRASKLGVKPGPPANLNPVRAARLLGVCKQIVYHWIRQGFLKADNRFGRRFGRHREWTIKPQDFLEFLRDYYYLYDPGRVEDKFLKEVISSTPAGKVMTISQASKVLGIVRSAVVKHAIAGKFPVAYKGFGSSGHTRWYIQLDRDTINETSSQIRYQTGDLVINQNFLDPGICGKIGKVVAANQEEVKVDFGEDGRIIRVYIKANLHHIVPYTGKDKTKALT